MLDFEVISPSVKAKASVICLHGLGSSGHDLSYMFSQLSLPEQLGFRFVFPHAPTQAVTLNMGMSMPSWYDIYALHKDAKQDQAGILQARQWVDALIAQECEQQSLASHQIFLAGFSQGGALALATGLTYPHRLAGIIALSTYLPIADHVLANLSLANRKMPIFMAHGTQDPIVSFDFGELACQHLQRHHYPVAWHHYPMAHVVCPAEMRDIAKWLQKHQAECELK